MWKGNVVRIDTGPDNRSHFEDLSLPLDAIMMEGHAQHRSPTMPVKGMLFRENQLGPQGEYHTPKQRQFVITISGAVEITCAGGTRVFGPGTCCLRGSEGRRAFNRELHGPKEPHHSGPGLRHSPFHQAALKSRIRRCASHRYFRTTVTSSSPTSNRVPKGVDI
jgi:hypothetical protein